MTLHPDDDTVPSLDSAATSPERPGAVIGRYTLLRKLGEGGFGAVFAAEQTEPVRRTVALKIIKLGMDTSEVITRFEQERQALALMDHPHVAKVLDAGATETGRPYFVMELVEGVPITEYCDQHRLTVRERLELMFSVCQAVQHAHGKGLIHRDLKPSNVLVATRDGHPHPKVIDFGVAKATSAKLTAKTLLTEQFQMIGTPLYMSPEQAAGSLDIDTRTDVYSLGVLLYEILTSLTPVEAETLRTAMYHEIQRLIRDVEPPKPSTRISDSSDKSLSEVASRRRIEPTRLAGVLRGDVDWIVMKALEKEPARRYDTASELAMDIRRYLSGEAVLAAPPSASYRAAKFVRRHKGSVAAAVAVLAALVAGLVGTLWQARVAARERDLARESAAEAKRLAGSEKEARALADVRAEEALVAKAAAEASEREAEKVAEFQANVLRRVDPSEMGRDLAEDLATRIEEIRTRRGDSDEARAAARASFDDLLSGVSLTDAARRIIDENILSPASDAVKEQFGAEPDTEARLREALAGTYKSLGMAEKSLPEAERRLAILTERFGPTNRETLRAQNEVGTILFESGRLKESEAALTTAASAYQEHFPADDEDALFNRFCIGVLGLSLRRAQESKEIFESILASVEQVHGKESVRVASTLQNLAIAHLNLHEEAAAVPLLERAHEIRVKELGPDNADTLGTQQRLASVYQSVGRADEAIATQLATIAALERVKGARHPKTLGALAALADIYKAQTRFDDAETLARQVLDARRTVLGDFHPETINSIQSLAMLHSTRGRHDAAEPLFVEALRRSETTYGKDGPQTMSAVNNLGVLYWYRGNLEEAERSFSRVLDYHLAREGEDSVAAAELMTNVAILKTRRRQLDEAEALLDKSVDVLSRRLGPEHQLTLNAKSSRGVLHFSRRDYTRAEIDLASLLSSQRKVLAADHPSLASTAYNLAVTYRKLDRDADAEPLLREALAARRRTIGPVHKETLDVVQELADLCFDAEREDEARPLVEELIAGRRAGASGVNATPATMREYAAVLLACQFEDLRDPAEALRIARQANEASGGSDPQILDTLAVAQAVNGALDEAIATQRRALDLLPADSPDRGDYEEHLAEYIDTPR